MPSEHARPRIAPGGRAELGFLNWTILKVGSRRLGGPVPNVMLTLARHRSLFRPWLWFASKLMPYGTLPATDAELVILRVAARCGSDYERAHHSALGKAAGLGDAVIAWSAEPLGSPVAAPAADGIDGARAELIVRGVDALLDSYDLDDDLWDELSAIYGSNQLLEFCMLSGAYAMLAGTLNAARVPLEAGAGMHKLR